MGKGSFWPSQNNRPRDLDSRAAQAPSRKQENWVTCFLSHGLQCIGAIRRSGMRFVGATRRSGRKLFQSIMYPSRELRTRRCSCAKQILQAWQLDEARTQASLVYFSPILLLLLLLYYPFMASTWYCCTCGGDYFFENQPG